MIDEAQARLKVTVIPAIALLLIATPGRADEQHMLPQDKARLSQFIQQKVQQEGAHAATDQPPGHVLTPWSDLAKRIAPQAAEQERKDRVARKEWVSGFVKACIEDTAPLISLDESIEAHERCYNFLNVHPIPEVYPPAFYDDNSRAKQCEDYCPKMKTK